MIRATRDWFKRNRTTLAVGAGLVGVGYLAAQYVVAKITEARQRLSEDRIARENLRRRFEQNQEDCTFTVLALLPTAAENVFKELPTESIAHELRQQRSERLARSAASSEIAPSDVPSAQDDDQQSFGSGSYVHASQTAPENSGEKPLRPRRSKVQLWNELKINSITRALTILYTLSLLTIFTRIQLNLLGRRNYLSSVVSLASPPPNSSKISLENHDDDNLEQDYGNDFETNRKYLTFSWWLLHRGWRAVMEKVERATIEVFGPVGLKEDLSFIRLSELIIEVRRRVEGHGEPERRAHKWLKYLLPPQEDEVSMLRESGILPLALPTGTSDTEDFCINQSLRRSLDETSDLIDSPSFSHVLTQMLDAGFSQLIDYRIGNDVYKNPSPETQLPGDLTSLLSGAQRIQELPDADESTDMDTAIPTTAKLATLLASFTKAARAMGSPDPAFAARSPGDLEATMESESPPPVAKNANEYLAAMEQVSDLEAFAAVVYSSNFEFEGVDAAMKVEEHMAAVTANALDIAPEGREAIRPNVADPAAALAENQAQAALERAWETAHANSNA